MKYWFSPFEISSETKIKLNELGWDHWEDEKLNLDKDIFILYDTPDRLAYLPTENLILGFEELLNKYNQYKLIAIWRLVKPNKLHNNLFPDINPIEAIQIKILIETHKIILDSYLNAELISEVENGEIDSFYNRRISNALNPNSVIEIVDLIKNKEKYTSEIESLKNTLQNSEKYISEIEIELKDKNNLFNNLEFNCELIEKDLNREKIGRKNISNKLAENKKLLDSAINLNDENKIQLTRVKSLFNKLFRNSNNDELDKYLSNQLNLPVDEIDYDQNKLQIKALLNSYSKSLERAKKILKKLVVLKNE